VVDGIVFTYPGYSLDWYCLIGNLLISPKTGLESPVALAASAAHTGQGMPRAPRGGASLLQQPVGYGFPPTHHLPIISAQ
jgi:hypothetical protein